MSLSLLDRTVSDGRANGHHHQQLQNPIKLSELRTWLTSKPFPEARIREEYEVRCCSASSVDLPRSSSPLEITD